MPSDVRSVEARLARLESCFGRLDERLSAVVEARKDWKEEVERRLEDNNSNAQKLMEERARDRAELVSLDLYNSRHQELKVKSESDFRELAQKIDTLAARLDQKMSDHNRDDVASHDVQDKAIAEITSWINNQKGRQWALGILVFLTSGLIGTAVQIFFHYTSTHTLK